MACNEYYSSRNAPSDASKREFSKRPLGDWGYHPFVSLLVSELLYTLVLLLRLSHFPVC